MYLWLHWRTSALKVWVTDWVLNLISLTFCEYGMELHYSVLLICWSKSSVIRPEGGVVFIIQIWWTFQGNMIVVYICIAMLSSEFLQLEQYGWTVITIFFAGSTLQTLQTHIVSFCPCQFGYQSSFAVSKLDLFGRKHGTHTPQMSVPTGDLRSPMGCVLMIPLQYIFPFRKLWVTFVVMFSLQDSTSPEWPNQDAKIRQEPQHQCFSVLIHSHGFKLITHVDTAGSTCHIMTSLLLVQIEKFEVFK